MATKWGPLQLSGCRCVLRATNPPMNIKTNSLPVIAFLAVIAALILVPVSAVVAGFAVSVAGTLLIVAADYGRSVEPVRAESRIIPFGAPGCSPVDLRKAA